MFTAVFPERVERQILWNVTGAGILRALSEKHANKGDPQ